MTSTATITINLIDAQDMPPSFIGTPYFGYIYEVSVPVSFSFLQTTGARLHKRYVYNIDFIFFQGSEIFTVYAKDGDQGIPNTIHYSIINGKSASFRNRF